MKRFRSATVLSILLAFWGGFFCHLLYQRWNPSIAEPRPENGSGFAAPAAEAQSFHVSFAPLSLPAEVPAERPLLQAREVDKIRALAGAQARVRGRIFRVGQSAKSNTYFLNFGPSREALTAVIFASAANLFERQRVQLKSFAGKEVEIVGEIKDHPQYGLEIIVEGPTQIRVLN